MERESEGESSVMQVIFFVLFLHAPLTSLLHTTSAADAGSTPPSLLLLGGRARLSSPGLSTNSIQANRAPSPLRTRDASTLVYPPSLSA